MTRVFLVSSFYDIRSQMKTGFYFFFCFDFDFDFDFEDASLPNPLVSNIDLLPTAMIECINIFVRWIRMSQTCRLLCKSTLGRQIQRYNDFKHAYCIVTFVLCRLKTSYSHPFYSYHRVVSIDIIQHRHYNTITSTHQILKYTIFCNTAPFCLQLHQRNRINVKNSYHFQIVLLRVKLPPLQSHQMCSSSRFPLLNNA